MRRAFAIGCLASTLLCCGVAPASAQSCAAIIFVSLKQDGTTLIDGNSIAPAAVPQTLSSLKPRAKVVKYYREAAGGEPTSAQSARMKPLLDAMMALRLPIGLSSKSDFSDYIDGDGHSRPSVACKV